MIFTEAFVSIGLTLQVVAAAVTVGSASTISSRVQGALTMAPEAHSAGVSGIVASHGETSLTSSSKAFLGDSQSATQNHGLDFRQLQNGDSCDALTQATADCLATYWFTDTSCTRCAIERVRGLGDCSAEHHNGWCEAIYVECPRCSPCEKFQENWYNCVCGRDDDCFAPAVVPAPVPAPVSPPTRAPVTPPAQVQNGDSCDAIAQATADCLATYWFTDTSCTRCAIERVRGLGDCSAEHHNGWCEAIYVECPRCSPCEKFQENWYNCVCGRDDDCFAPAVVPAPVPAPVSPPTRAPVTPPAQVQNGDSCDALTQATADCLATYWFTDTSCTRCAIERVRGLGDCSAEHHNGWCEAIYQECPRCSPCEKFQENWYNCVCGREDECFAQAVVPAPVPAPVSPPTRVPLTPPTTPKPAVRTTSMPRPVPTKRPTSSPTPMPESQPDLTTSPVCSPTPMPSKQPQPEPTPSPTNSPTPMASKQPQPEPTPSPTNSLTSISTLIPTDTSDPPVLSPTVGVAQRPDEAPTTFVLPIQGDIPPVISVSSNVASSAVHPVPSVTSLRIFASWSWLVVVLNF